MQRPRGRNELGVWEEERQAGVQRGSSGEGVGGQVKQTPGPSQSEEMSLVSVGSVSR